MQLVASLAAALLIVSASALTPGCTTAVASYITNGYPTVSNLQACYTKCAGSATCDCTGVDLIFTVGGCPSYGTIYAMTFTLTSTKTLSFVQCMPSACSGSSDLIGVQQILMNKYPSIVVASINPGGSTAAYVVPSTTCSNALSTPAWMTSWNDYYTASMSCVTPCFTGASTNCACTTVGAAAMATECATAAGAVKITTGVATVGTTSVTVATLLCWPTACVTADLTNMAVAEGLWLKNLCILNGGTGCVTVVTPSDPPTPTPTPTPKPSSAGASAPALGAFIVAAVLAMAAAAM